MGLIRRIVCTAVLLGLAQPVGAQSVTIDYDRTADFAHIRTFAIQVATGWGNAGAERRVLEEFARAIAGRGWTMISEEEMADVLVMLHGVSSERHTGEDFHRGSTAYTYGWGTDGGSMPHKDDYAEGTLVVEMFDLRDRRAIWRGTATDQLSQDPALNLKKVEKVCAKMFKNFPPGSKHKKNAGKE